jgi:hypothetical protein
MRWHEHHCNMCINVTNMLLRSAVRTACIDRSPTQEVRCLSESEPYLLRRLRALDQAV